MIKKIITILIIAIIFFGLGFFISNFINENKAADAYEAGWSAAKQRLYETGILESVEKDYPIKSVIGDIQKIESNKIYLKINPVEALAKKDLDNRIIQLDDKTKIYAYQQKNEGQILKEKEELSRQGTLQEPEIYEKIEISRDVLKAQERIIVYSQKDIRNDKEFIASEIIVHE